MHHVSVVAIRDTSHPRVVVDDARGNDQSVRMTWHAERQMVTISLWRGGLCVASSCVAAADVAALVEVLGAALPEPLTDRQSA